MIDYLFAHAQELGINTNEICVFSLCRSVNYTIECVLRYPEIKKMILHYGKISTNTKLANCANMKFFIALGELDKKYSSSCNDWFLEKANPYNYSVELCVHPQGGHGFDYANDDQYTKEIIEKTIEFMKSQAGQLMKMAVRWWENTKNKDQYFSCPYASDGRNCKHMAAVLQEWPDREREEEQLLRFHNTVNRQVTPEDINNDMRQVDPIADPYLGRKVLSLIDWFLTIHMSVRVHPVLRIFQHNSNNAAMACFDHKLN